MNFPEIENKILKFWHDNKVFDKLRDKNRGKKKWSFLDGPITANNPMGVHHAWGRTYKDVFQRYKAMQGYEQRFQNGFDCQGLWVEVEVEKELGFKSKKDIENYGIDKFVEKCKERVRKYSKIQTDQSVRLGQWMDWDNSYYTMSDDNNYTIWGFLKKCHEKGLVFKGHDAVPWCPRCGTAISQHEILTEDYKEITHDSLYLEYPLLDKKDEFLLVWTTTPWTLPGNVAVAVDPEKEYALATGSEKGSKYYVLKSFAEKLGLKVMDVFKGEKLVGLKYESPFDDLPRVKNSLGKFVHEVVSSDPLILPISDTEGTGLVHVAPGQGTEDFRLGKKMNLPIIELINEAADYLDGLDEFSNKNAKEHPEMIIDFLKNKDGGKYLFDVKPITHRYPVCWRCKSELVWRVVDEWYISMEKLRDPLVKIAKKIKWIPSFGLERELDWLKNMQDWLISKKRYWGLALPVFECKECGNFEVIGSKKELKERAVEGWENFEGHTPHRPWVDEVKIKCSKCGAVVSRIKDVGNPWLDAGIVPFSTMVDPKTKELSYAADKKYWKEWFPAQFICESFPGQFKNWFYSLLVMSVVLEDANPTETIFGYASVHDEKDEEMHKSKGNAIWFDDAVEKIGADPMRWMYMRQNPAENLRFGYNAADEIKRKLLTLYNSIEFFHTYADKKEASSESKNILDRWIVSRLNSLIEKMTQNLNEFNAMSATLAAEDFFINDLSLWYIRRSRKRFQNPSDEKEKNEAVGTLYGVLLNFLKLIAPVMPFFAEENYQKLREAAMPESIHLVDWPKAGKLIDEKLEEGMAKVREIVTQALAERAKAGIKVRQPLLSLKLKNSKIKIDEELLDLIKDEVNVKEILFDDKIGSEVKLDLDITPELREEGLIREIIRNIQGMRKEANLKPKDQIKVEYQGTGELASILENNREGVIKEAKVKELSVGGESGQAFDTEKTMEADGQKLLLKIKKI